MFDNKIKISRTRWYIFRGKKNSFYMEYGYNQYND